MVRSLLATAALAALPQRRQTEIGRLLQTRGEHEGSAALAEYFRWKRDFNLQNINRMLGDTTDGTDHAVSGSDAETKHDGKEKEGKKVIDGAREVES